VVVLVHSQGGGLVGAARPGRACQEWLLYIRLLETYRSCTYVSYLFVFRHAALFFAVGHARELGHCVLVSWLCVPWMFVSTAFNLLIILRRESCFSEN
jgi:hypothetical protein